MAFGAQNIFPIDQNARKAVGVSLPFNSPVAFTSTFTTKDAVRSNLINYLLTNPGERPLNPTFGTGIRRYIFEQIDDNTFSELQIKIQNDISQYFPYIQSNVVITANPDNNYVTVNISYIILNNGATKDTLTIELNNI
jgi:phage baseplate assembly protein W